ETSAEPVSSISDSAASSRRWSVASLRACLGRATLSSWSGRDGEAAIAVLEKANRDGAFSALRRGRSRGENENRNRVLFYGQGSWRRQAVPAPAAVGRCAGVPARRAGLLDRPS